VTTAGKPGHQAVTALRPPPAVQSALVRSDIRHTFDPFVRTIGEWWPTQPFSARKTASAT